MNGTNVVCKCKPATHSHSQSQSLYLSHFSLFGKNFIAKIAVETLICVLGKKRKTAKNVQRLYISYTNSSCVLPPQMNQSANAFMMVHKEKERKKKKSAATTAAATAQNKTQK